MMTLMQKEEDANILNEDRGDRQWKTKEMMKRNEMTKTKRNRKRMREKTQIA